MGRYRIGLRIVLLVVAAGIPGCIHPVRTTFKATKFAVKTTGKVVVTGVKVVTWPVRALRGEHKAAAAAAPGTPAPIAAGQAAADPGFEDETVIR